MTLVNLPVKALGRRFTYCSANLPYLLNFLNSNDIIYHYRYV